MASSFSFTDECIYDVFLSFRGLDTRSGFTGSLHRALCGKGIKSFMDDKDLKKGAEINPALDEAIQSSRITVVVLSKNYASSTFCLDELRKIMDCSKNKGMLVLPVFYEVEPSDVRYQKGKYADALNKHEARISEKEKIEKWRVALTEISHISGWTFCRDKYEYELIDIIVEDIIKKIRSSRDGEKDRITCKGDDKYVTQHDKVKYSATEFLSPDTEVEAMKIQHAFRNFNEARKRVAAMKKIQHALVFNGNSIKNGGTFIGNGNGCCIGGDFNASTTNLLKGSNSGGEKKNSGSNSGGRCNDHTNGKHGGNYIDNSGTFDGNGNGCSIAGDFNA